MGINKTLSKSRPPWRSRGLHAARTEDFWSSRVTMILDFQKMKTILFFLKIWSFNFTSREIWRVVSSVLFIRSSTFHSNFDVYDSKRYSQACNGEGQQWRPLLWTQVILIPGTTEHHLTELKSYLIYFQWTDLIRLEFINFLHFFCKVATHGCRDIWRGGEQHTRDCKVRKEIRNKKIRNLLIRPLCSTF